MNVLAALKFGALVLWSAFAFYMGGLKTRETVATQHVAQLTALGHAFEAQSTKLQAVENAYDALKDVPDPVSVGLAYRMQVYECPTVPIAGTVAGRVNPTGPIPTSDAQSATVLKFTQDIFDACSADANQLNALIALKPT